MIFCTNCTRLLDEDVRFCPHCNTEDTEFNQDEEQDVFQRLGRINNHLAAQEAEKAAEAARVVETQREPGVQHQVEMIVRQAWRVGGHGAQLA